MTLGDTTDGDGVTDDAAIDGDGVTDDAAIDGDGVTDDAAIDGDGVTDGAAPAACAAHDPDWLLGEEVLSSMKALRRVSLAHGASGGASSSFGAASTGARSSRNHT